MPDAEISATVARTSFWLLVLTGVIGGVLSGAFGVGGGILMVPLLINLIGMNQRQASATSLLAIVPTSIAGAVTYLAAGQVDLLAGLFLAIGGVIGSYFGTRMLRSLPLGVLRWLFIALIVIVAVRMVLFVPHRGDGHVDITVGSALGLVVVGVFIGVASGLFGIGGGVIAVPALIAVFGLGDLVAKGTSLLFMIPTAITGSIQNVRHHVIDVRSGVIVGLAATVASFGGVALAFLMPPAVSSYLFAALLLVSAVQLSVRAWRARGR